MTAAGPTALPTALAPWARELVALDHGSALALGPLVHRLDELVGRHTSAHADGGGTPDGYDGVSPRGRPERLLVSQWLLAQELPDEFVRRAAAGELLHLAPAPPRDVESGQTVLLVDCGPDLHGAPRLLQLALAVVLHRRATAAGRGFALGVLGREPGAWLDGDLPRVLERWLAARSSRPVDATGVRAWLAALDRPQDAWVVTAPPVADELAAGAATARRPHVVTVTETDWTASGPSALAVGLAGERLHLPLPEPDVAVRILRGHGWRRAPRASGVSAGAAGAPWFPGPAPVLMARGPRPQVLVHQRVPAPGRAAGSLRRQTFSAPVLAATAIGRRLIVLTARNGILAASVVGRSLGAVDGLSVPLGQLGLSDADVADAAAGPPAPLHVVAGEVLTRLGGGWWALRADGTAEPRPDVAAVVPFAALDATAVVDRTVLPDDGRPGLWPPDPGDGNPPNDLLVGAGRTAWHAAPQVWYLRPARGSGGNGPAGGPISVPDGARAIGVADVQGRVGVVAVSRAGVLVTLSTIDRTTTLTRWSGGTALPVVHPLLPLIAVRRDDGTIEVGRIGTEQLCLRWEPQP